MSTNLIGKTLLNQYRVDSFIASGGMGAVYRVWDLKRNVPLAMKVLHTELAEDPSVFKRFQREARALKKLAHPNIVPFYGLFQTQDFAFLLERFVDGPTLRDVLQQRRGKPLPIDEALIYLKAISAAIGYAHANGVVHCDIKPGNVMIDPGGNVYMTDFGIARHSDSATTTVGAAGTPAYMAPEQIRGEPVTPATDVYALGVTLFEMLTGQRPFRGNEAGTEGAGPTAAERIRYAQINLIPPDPRTLNPAISPQLADAMLRAMVKQTEGRYKSTQELFVAACSAVNIDPQSLPDRVAPLHMAEKTISAAPLPGGAKQAAHGEQLYQPVPAQTRSFPLWAGWAVAGALGLVILTVIGIVILSSAGKASRLPTSTGNQASNTRPTSQPSAIPFSLTPTFAPRETHAPPTSAPLSTSTPAPTERPRPTPSHAPTNTPSRAPTNTSTRVPTRAPSITPTRTLVPTKQPVINSETYDSGQCPYNTHLTYGMYAFALAEVNIYDMPRYEQKRGYPDPRILATLQPGDRIMIYKDTYPNARNPNCARKSYFWYVHTAFEDPTKDPDIEGWVFEYYYEHPKDSYPIFEEKYYLGPYKP